MSRQEPPVKTDLGFEAFLEFEMMSQERHEFVDRQLFLMAGGTPKHNRIAGRIYAQVLTLTENTACQVYMSDVLIRTPNEIGYYPDVFSVCNDEEPDSRVKRKLCFIIEVLSESTEAIDRGEKFRNYQKIPDLQTYVLLDQTEPRVEMFSRQMDGSWRFEMIETGGMLKLPCIKLEIPLAEIYAGL